MAHSAYASGLEDTLNGPNHLIEALALGGELFPPGGRQSVVAGAPIVVGRAPLGLDPAIQQQSLECGIEGALTNRPWERSLPGQHWREGSRSSVDAWRSSRTSSASPRAHAGSQGA